MTIINRVEVSPLTVGNKLPLLVHTAKPHMILAEWIRHNCCRAAEERSTGSKPA